MLISQTKLFRVYLLGVHYGNQWLCRVPGAHGKAQFALGKDHSVKNGSAKAALPSVFCRALGKAFAECPTLGKVGTEKTRKNENFYAKKMEIFLIGGGPHRPAPTHLRHFSRKIRGYAVLIE